jgi:hypothetical protein
MKDEGFRFGRWVLLPAVRLDGHQECVLERPLRLARCALIHSAILASVAPAAGQRSWSRWPKRQRPCLRAASFILFPGGRGASDGLH